jgi:hypothetical protein
MHVYIEGIGLWAPGLEGWQASRDILCGRQAYQPRPANLPPTQLLPPNERRRTVTTVKLALVAGAEAFDNAKRKPGATATVFTSSGGDGDTIHGILDGLVSGVIDVSPTRFHNSVHNAPSGYWNIATKTQEPATSLCAHDASFAVGLLEAAVQATVDDCDVTLVAYDLPYPEPLNAHRPITSMFGAAFVLAPRPSNVSLARLEVICNRDAPSPSPMADAGLETLRAGNPAARSLPLLAVLAQGVTAQVTLDHTLGNRLAVAVTPTSR